MPKPDQTNVPAAIEPHLRQGESLSHYAYGVKQPPIGVIVLLFLLAVLPGAIATALMTKHFFVGLTDGNRFVVVRIKSFGNHTVQEVWDYPLDQLDRNQVKVSKGPVFTHIRIADPNKPFVAKFHRAGMKTNREHSLAIGSALSGRQLTA